MTLPPRLVTTGASGSLGRRRFEIRGAVQGVGFRPFVYRLAREHRLAGWVRNDARGVVIEVEGNVEHLARFRSALETERPAAAEIHELEATVLAATGETGFRIVASEGAAGKSAVILPDLATCPDCLRELFDAADRRYHYPFTNCTNCGPRFTIVHDLPYDRLATTMRGFTMCPACRSEYEDPTDRRFHAQPNACPSCGPALRLLDPSGAVRAEGDAALLDAADALRGSRIVALKGLGGYQLLVDARDRRAVAELRERKRRPVKPLAVMVRDLAAARELAEVSAAEAELLAGREAPIVLLPKRADGTLAAEIAPDTPLIGLMLPTTPLHHLLLAELGFPVVATSGNLSDEPIAFEDGEALERLGSIADLFLAHDRPVARHVDDSVAWVAEGAPQIVRRARGWAPMPLRIGEGGATLVAVGAHQKDVAALALGRQVFLSQHLGDMETPEARSAFERVVLDFIRVYEARPEAIAHDLHPDYPTTIWARAAARAEGGLLARCGLAAAALPLVAVQHHHAHLAAALAEHDEGAPIGALTWDGTGYGGDGTVWGGELLAGDAGGFERIARLRPFRLAGGEGAVREPRRVALALISALEPGQRTGFDPLSGLGLTEIELGIFERLLDSGSGSPLCSSVGRLFDGVAAIAGLPGRVSFEGEAAIRFEAVAASDGSAYPLPIDEVPAPAGLAPGQRSRSTLLELDWRPLVGAALADRRRGVAAATISGRFHAALADGARELIRASGSRIVALTGGCFQNRILSREIARRLRADGCMILVHRKVPANDGGIALGQVVVARARLHAAAEG